MKTTVNVIAMPMASSFDELIFNNRNRAYGAYELRKKYNKRLLIGFIFGFFVFGTGISVPMIQAYFISNAVVDRPKDDGVRILENPNLDPPKPPTPPPPPIETAQVRFIPPVVTDSLTETEIEIDITDASLANAENGNVNDALNNTPVATPIEIEPPVDEGIWQVQEPASFMGGDVNTFRIWVQKNLNYPQAAAEAGVQGKVTLIFSVNKKGEVCDVKTLRGLHPSINDEAVRVLMSSPQWIPAKQNGRIVKQNFSIPLSFQLQ